jgi:hypothetical protein
MSTSLAVSTDYGLTWKSYGQILTGTDTPTANKQTGEGSCSTVNGQDGYYYAYCFRNRMERSSWRADLSPIRNLASG